jgi:hypothetical protein
MQVQSELRGYEASSDNDWEKIRDLEEEVAVQKGLVAEAIKEKDAAIGQIQSMFAGAGRFLGYNIEVHLYRSSFLTDILICLWRRRWVLHPSRPVR